MFPSRFEPILFGLILSGIMSFMVSGVATLRTLGPVPDFPGEWVSAWTYSWPVAFVAVLVVTPLVRRVVSLLVRSDD